jgi:ribosomal protein S18 acetylase RimI-like enzyme
MVTITRASENHVASIGQLWLEFMWHHQQIDPIFEPRENSVPGFEEYEVRRLMNSSAGLVLVALDGNRVVGFSLSEIHEPMQGYKLDRFGIISTMAVTADYRHQHVGENMVQEIYQWFRAENIKRVEIEVLVGNQIGDSFWRKQGFTDHRYRLFRTI